MKAPGRVESKKRRSNSMEIKVSLNEEIVWLQKRLQDQFLVRRALEKAYYLPFSHYSTLDDSVPESAKELIKEIAALEQKVSHLEQYLLSLYRRRFDEQISSLPSNDQRRKLAIDDHKRRFTFTKKNVVIEKEASVICSSKMSPRNSIDYECQEQLKQKELLDSSIHRTYSTLSQRSASTFITSPPRNLTKVEDLYHSLPLSMLEQAERASSNAVSLMEHDGTSFFDDVPETPNWISEELIKSIAAIYCELADPSFDRHDHNASSTNSFSTSFYEFPSRGQGQRWGSNSSKLQFFTSQFHIPFHVRSSKGFTGPYHSMVRIQGLCRDGEKLKEIEYMLRRFRSLVDRLEKVDPRKMKHKEKFAFWINVHNTLVMHAWLVYGVPLNDNRRMSLVLKAAYNVGGSTISVDMIQNYILGCRFPRPGQANWLRLFFSSKSKLKGEDARKAYGLQLHHHEPLSRFALNMGCYSDPAIRLYTSERIYEELETAKEEYIQSNFSINKENKILLPRIVEYFAKDSGLCASALLKMIESCIPESQRTVIQQYQPIKNWKFIDWVPHDFTFCCLLSEELA